MSTAPSRIWPRFVLVLVLAAALRLPGIDWGFAVEPGAYHQLHPDEIDSCFELWTRGRAWLDDPENWHERGMQVQCWALASVMRTVGSADWTATTFVRAARGYSVLCGLLGIFVAALVARALDPIRETRDASALYAALLCALAGAHLVTSFWARSQIQNSLCFFASVYLAQRSLGGRAAPGWLFAAGIAAGAAIGLRWSVALLPMLVVAAFATRTRAANLIATGLGCVVGFAASTAFVWTPAQVVEFVRVQRQAMLGLQTPVGPIVIGSAAVLCAFTGAGLATSALGVLGLARRAGKIGRLATPEGLLVVPVAVQLAMVATVDSFEARHTDVLSIALAIVAGVELARMTTRPGMRRRAAAVLVAATVLYQTVYAWGVLVRFTRDPRNYLAARLADVVPRDAPIFVSWYVPGDALAHAGFTLTAERCSAAYVVVSEQHALRYLGRSGTFLALGKPTSCDEIYNCWSEHERRFYQALFGGRAAVVRRFPAAVWTPELALYRWLLGSKWMFTADLVVLTAPRPEPDGTAADWCAPPAPPRSRLAPMIG